ncbi:4764_t:CDS:1 [Ambispora leptoticha]|uniref:4764_t:CDS:1 n=1 Tax=Ambispora leptoticha TaxID=144679 RepID=A0A9N9F0L2_9GLOM|nr:4764_t:CDS:1 [Ambispora leptoticha]
MMYNFRDWPWGRLISRAGGGEILLYGITHQFGSRFESIGPATNIPDGDQLHCHIERFETDGGITYIFRDTSRYGTYINNKLYKSKPKILEEGDVIRFETEKAFYVYTFKEYKRPAPRHPNQPVDWNTVDMSKITPLELAFLMIPDNWGQQTSPSLNNQTSSSMEPYKWVSLNR